MRTGTRLTTTLVILAIVSASATPAGAEVRNGRIAFDRLYNGYFRHVHTVRPDGSDYRSPD